MKSESLAVHRGGAPAWALVVISVDLQVRWSTSLARMNITHKAGRDGSSL